MDNLTKEQRRKNMQHIKYKNTSIEICLRKALWNSGIRYRKNVNKLPGKPDIVIAKYNLAIFCDSEFWHSKDWNITKNKIKSNTSYWYNKIESNIARDKKITEELEKAGWIVLRFWGEDIIYHLEACIEKIKQIILQKS